MANGLLRHSLIDNDVVYWTTGAPVTNPLVDLHVAIADGNALLDVRLVAHLRISHSGAVASTAGGERG